MVTFLDGGDITVTGTETMTKPGGYQFAATGGNGPYTWSVEGTGVTIDSSTGYVTALNSACGSFTVTCTDCTGRSGSHVGTRITNNGTWTSYVAGPCGYNGSVQSEISCEHPCSQYYALYGSSWGDCGEEDIYVGVWRVHLHWSSMVGYRWIYCPDCPECPPTDYPGLMSLHMSYVDAACAGVEGVIPARVKNVVWSGNCNNWYQACETTGIWPVKWTC